MIFLKADKLTLFLSFFYTGVCFRMVSQYNLLLVGGGGPFFFLSPQLFLITNIEQLST